MLTGFKKVMRKAAWAPAAIFLIHTFISLVFGHKPALDPSMHFLGGMAMAFFFHELLNVSTALFGESRYFPRLILSFCFATTVAVFWEFMEFGGGEATGVYSQHSIKETMYDLLLGCGGAACYVMLQMILGFKKPKRP
jgi:hypothetical protein